MSKKKMNGLSWFGYALVMTGAILWGIFGVTGLFGTPYNVVEKLFSFAPVIGNIIFALVGISGLYALGLIPKLTK